MKSKSLKLNAMCNAASSVSSMIFPLITFPYVSRILGVDGLGKVNFSSSIVSYFVLLAGLGIETYAIREGARLRDKKNEFENFASDILSINVASAAISYILLVLVLAITPKLIEYKALILVISIQIAFKTIGRSWIFNVYEDYIYQTISSIAVQFLAIIFLYVFVKNENDLMQYAVFSILNTVICSIVNVPFSQKYCKIKFSLHPAKAHWRPIALIFSTAISNIIYSSSDLTLLGIFGTDYNVGLYSVSVKIYSLIRTFLGAMLIVTIPRFSYMIGTNQTEEFQRLFNKVLNILILVMIPAVFGMTLLSKEIIYAIAGPEFTEASTSLKILSLAIVFNLLTYVLAYGMLIPLKKEKTFFVATVIGASCNVLLNFLLIPYYFENAAAFTTVVSEFVVMLICIVALKKYSLKIDVKKNLACIICGCFSIALICCGAKAMIPFGYIRLIVSVSLSIIAYAFIQIVLCNDTLNSLINIRILKD